MYKRPQSNALNLSHGSPGFLGIYMPVFLNKRVNVDGLFLREVREGSTTVYIPDIEKYVRDRSEYIPTSLPVFYNPQAELSRDTTVLIVSAFIRDSVINDVIYLEAMAGTGIRGFRVLNETKVNKTLRIILNDANPFAAKLMEINKKEFFNNTPHVEIYNTDANYLFNSLRLRNLRPNIIEIDPAGTPAPFLFDAIRCIKIGGMLIVTATDTSCLYGKYPDACMRKYGSYVIINPFPREIGVRVLLYAIGREASKISRSIIPVFSLATHNFVRVAVKIERGKTKANDFWKHQVGWILFCPACLYFEIYKGFSNIPHTKKCPRDKIELSLLGPLYVGKIYDENFVRNMLQVLPQMEFSAQNKRLLEKYLMWMLESKHIPLYYSLREIARRIKTSIPSINGVIETLRSKGYIATRTHFDETGVKTNANIDEVYAAFLAHV